MPSTPLDRRSFLAGTAGSLALAATDSAARGPAKPAGAIAWARRCGWTPTTRRNAPGRTGKRDTGPRIARTFPWTTPTGSGPPRGLRAPRRGDRRGRPLVQPDGRRSRRARGRTSRQSPTAWPWPRPSAPAAAWTSPARSTRTVVRSPPGEPVRSVLRCRGGERPEDHRRGEADAAKFCYEMMGWALPDSPDSYLRLIEGGGPPGLRRPPRPLQPRQLAGAFYASRSCSRSASTSWGRGSSAATPRT